MAIVFLDFDRHLPLKGIFWLAKRLGFSKQIARVLTRYSTSAKRMGKPFSGYQPTKRDVFVATYFKSGTNSSMP